MDNDRSEETPPTRGDVWVEAKGLLEEMVGVPDPVDVLALAKFLDEDDRPFLIPPGPDDGASEFANLGPLTLRDEQGAEFETVRIDGGNAFLFITNAGPLFLTHSAAREQGVGPRDLLYRKK